MLTYSIKNRKLIKLNVKMACMLFLLYATGLVEDEY